MTSAISRLPQVRSRTGLSRSTIYNRIKERSFPAPIRLGPRTIGWPWVCSSVYAVTRTRVNG
jgi:prophage regulatory protein